MTSKATDLQAFARGVAEALAKRRWSQGKLARTTGIAQPQISRVLNGKGGASLEFARRIALAFDTTVDALVQRGVVLLAPTIENDVARHDAEIKSLQASVRVLVKRKRK